MERVGLARLTPRQRTCIELVAAHVSPKQIARDLGITENTVRGYLKEVVEILGARDLRDAARIFLAGVEPSPPKLGGPDRRVAESAVIPPKTGAEEAVTTIDPVRERAVSGSFPFLRGGGEAMT